MSEENEHTTEETEAEMSTENHSKEQSKTETSMLNNETEQPMLEDEEMPTYISVSSPSRREDSDAHDTKQQDRIPIEEEHSRSPYPSDDQGADSIYVLSSGDESNHPFNYEEDEEYGDSEEDEEEEDEDDDDEENPLRLPTNYDEDVDPEYEQECFDRASDDFILNNRLRQYHKERSLSLQDLSSLKSNINTAFNRKRHSLNVFRHNYLGMQPPSVVYPVANKKQVIPIKYQHVESKVKQYIKDIKEQNRRSIEKRVKEQQFVTTTNNEESEDNNAQQLKGRVGNKMIKDYAEKALKDIEQDENGSGSLVYNVAHIIANGENNKTSNKVVEKEYKQIQKDTDIQIETSTQNCDDKLEKRNGSIDDNAHHVELQNTLNKKKQFSNVNQSSLVNGHQQSPTIINLNALNYAQYVHGPLNSEEREESVEQEQDNTNETHIYTDVEMINAQDIGNSNADCPLKIENVKSIRVAQDESATLTFTKLTSADKVNAENAEIIRLKAQLSQKDAQFLNLRDAYQKTLMENIKMKQELEALKKSLTKYESEKKTCETKIASVQTEKDAALASNHDITTSEKTNKMSTSSVASTISSIDHWADSACSPAISIKAPDLTPILNSDDSIVLSNGVTPRNTAHPLSRTFITSSRILQTLSNITQGKTRAESPLLKNTTHSLNEKSANHLLNLNCNSPIHASNSKKRKAADMLSSSTFIQPFKIPHVTVESEEKTSNDSTDEFKYSQAHSNSKTEKQENTTANENNGSTSTETKIQETNDDNDCVKCFIYRDHEDSRNRSFLIQAEEPTKETVDNGKHRIQECGPYLLGNLEVRMSEINGTISVWGKEVNRESTSDNEDMVEMSGRSTDKKLCQSWQNESRSRFNGSSLVCSSGNKQKVPLRLNKSSTSQCCQSVSLNSIKTPSFVDDVNCKRHLSTSHSLNTSVRSFGNCESSKYHKECTACKGASTSRENLHSCCTHHTEIIDNECNCRSCRERQKYDVTSKCCKDKFHSKGIQRNLCRSTPEPWNHLQENTNTNAGVNDVLCKYHTTCRHFLPNVIDTCGPHSKCNIDRDVPCTCQSCTQSTSHHDNSDKHTCKNFSNDCDVDPLLSFKRSNETLTTRQRRLSGKRVRGILMDLLRGCGDCRSNNASRLSNSETQQREPEAKSAPAYTPEATCSSNTQCRERCCRAYALRIESQLEEFRSEMERVRSRSDAILEMLNVLHSVDVN